MSDCADNLTQKQKMMNPCKLISFVQVAAENL